jgi:micrococcal nuclease
VRVDTGNLFHYRATVQSVYDGDTCTVDIDLGLGIWVRGEKVRLYGINAPEVRGDERPAGLLSRDFLRELIDGKEVLIRTLMDKKGKYGRYIAEVFVEQDGAWINTSDALVAAGHAEYHDY